MMIFGFGFLLGGFTAILILGLLSLANHRTAIPKDQGAVSEPMRDGSDPAIYPQLSVLSGSQDRSSFTGYKAKACS